MLSKTRGKNASPLMSNSISLPARQASLIGGPQPRAERDRTDETRGGGAESQYFRIARGGIAQINTVQPEPGPTRWKAAGRFTELLDKDFVHSTVLQNGIGALAPVVKIPRHDHRLARGQALNQPAQQ